jgi:hypothetical protein
MGTTLREARTTLEVSLAFEAARKSPIGKQRCQTVQLLVKKPSGRSVVMLAHSM